MDHNVKHDLNWTLVWLVICYHTGKFNKIFPDVSIKDLRRSIDPDVTLETYNGSCINQLGTCKLNINGASKELCQAIFFIVPDYCRPILGLQSCIDLDLIDVKCPTTEKWNLGATIPPT